MPFQDNWSDVGDERTESRIVLQPFCIPSVKHPERRTSVVVVRQTDVLLLSRYKRVSRFETRRIPTGLTCGRWMEQMSRPHGPTFYEQCK